MNNLPPQFESPWTPETPYYEYSIPERQPVPDYVTTVRATDPNPFDYVLFRLLNDTEDFTLVTDTGALCLTCIN